MTIGDARIRDLTIAVQDDTGTVRKVTKLVFYRQGGFAVLAPYHRERRGVAVRMPVDYSQVGHLQVPRSEMVEFTAEDRVKLSLHADGFAQFSGENPGRTISGRDPDTGIPRGIGIVGQPFENPVLTGPTFGVTLWGLGEFEVLREADGNALVFSDEDFYFGLGAGPDANAVSIEGFLFPAAYWQAVRRRGGQYVMSLPHRNFMAPDATFDWIVVPLAGQPVIIGLRALRVHVEFNSVSGYQLAGPGGYAALNFTRAKYVILAMYPPPMDDPPVATLTYQPPPGDLPQ